MVKFDILEYGIYEDGTHIADFDDKEKAIGYAKADATVKEVSVVVISNFTGEVIAEYSIETKTVVKEWVAD